MTDSDRREFLKKAATAAAALGIPATASAGTEGDANEASMAAGAAPGSAGQQTAAAPAATPAETLRAVGAAVLPAGTLGAGGIESVVSGFEAWIAGFEPVAEQPHGYLNRGLAEIRYGPPHPGPRWAAQIEALELEANRRHRARFAELSVEIRRQLIEGQLERDELDRLPGPAQARHVALGLMAFFYDSSEAADLCYEASIGRFRCRGLSALGREPQPLAAGDLGREPQPLAGGPLGREPQPLAGGPLGREPQTPAGGPRRRAWASDSGRRATASDPSEGS
jgi:hypothetical protein